MFNIKWFVNFLRSKTIGFKWSIYLKFSILHNNIFNYKFVVMLIIWISINVSNYKTIWTQKIIESLNINIYRVSKWMGKISNSLALQNLLKRTIRIRKCFFFSSSDAFIIVIHFDLNRCLIRKSIFLFIFESLLSRLCNNRISLLTNW